MGTDTAVRPRPTVAAGGPSGLPVTSWVLRQQRRTMLGWSVALGVVAAIYVSFYPAMGGDEMTDLIETLPEGLIQALGYDTIATATGYLDSTVYSLLAPALMLVFGIAFGARVLAGQEEDGTLELELTLPIERRRVLLERFLALALQLALFAGVVFTVVTLLVLALGMDVGIGNLGAATLGLFLLTLAMGSVSLAVGAATGRKASGIAAGAGLAVAGFMANALSPLIEGGQWLANISPFAWYLGGDPLDHGIDWAGFGGLLAITVVALAVALTVFERRDLGV
jgi:ABC-2 type transport system permease protein